MSEAGRVLAIAHTTGGNFAISSISSDMPIVLG